MEVIAENRDGRRRPSLKRRRCWFELGVVGCYILVTPAQGDWISSTWRRLHTQRPEKASDHGSLRLPGSIQSRNHDHHNDRYRRLDIGMEVEAHLHAAIGEWSTCSAECTRTRTVLCETRDFKIVADHLCGDLLPSKVEGCTTDKCDADEDSSSAPSATPSANSPDGGAGAENSKEGKNRRPSDLTKDRREEGDKTKSPNVRDNARSSRARDKTMDEAADPMEESTAHASLPNAEDKTSTATRGRDGEVSQHKPNPSASTHNARGITGPFAPDPSSQEASSTDKHALQTDSRDESDADESAGEATGSDATSGSTSDRSVRGHEQRLHSKSDGAGGSSQPGDHASAESHGTGDGTKTTGSRPQDDSLLGNTKEPKGSSFSIKRIEGGPGAEQARSWTVLAIGVTAVGSFLAVVFLAINQYRKEQHRLQGITALNEFPLDNYVNPFCAKEYTDEDRSAFKL